MSSRITLALLASFVAVACLVKPALADKQYKTIIISPPGSPVTLTACEAWARDWNKTVLTAHAWVTNILLDLGVQFTNNSTKTLKDVRFSFVSYDAFNTEVSSVELDTSQDVSADSISMAPGAVIDLMGPRGWHAGNKQNGKDHVVCSVERVAFADGTMWSAPSPAPTVQQSPSPTPK